MSDKIINFKDNDNLAGFLKKFPRRVKSDIHEELVDIANDYRKEVDQRMLNTPRSSKKYIRGKGRTHSPSLPWHPPAIDSGNLRKGMIVERIIDGAQFGVYGAPYVKWLEPIGEPSKKMTPRPVFQPTFDEMEAQNRSRITRIVTNSIRKAS